MNDFVTVAPHARSNISWGSIFAGALIALALQITFMTLGSAIGFTAFDPAQGDSLGGGSLVRFGVFTLLTSLVSLFAGAYATGRLSGDGTRFNAGAHGLATWAVVAVATVFMVGSGVGSVLRTAGSVAGTAVQGVATTAAGAAGSINIDPNTIADGARQLLRDTGKKELDPTRLKNEAGNLPTQAAKAQANPNGRDAEGVVGAKVDEKLGALDRDAAANVMAKRLNISKAEATNLIAQGEAKAEQLAADAKVKLEEVKAQSIEVAQAGTRIAARVSWVAFFSLVLGALAAVFGSVMGGTAAVRSYAEFRSEVRKVA